MHYEFDVDGEFPLDEVEVKFRDKDQKTAMHRLDPVLQELDQDPEENEEDISTREAQLLPTYTQVAQEFADLHDRSGRMKAKGVIRDVVRWEDARSYFHARLTRRLDPISTFEVTGRRHAF